MMVKSSGSLVETARVPRVVKPELLKIEVVTKFVAKRAEERAEGRDLFAHRRPHPHSDQHRFGCVVPEKFARPVFANAQGPGCEHADFAPRDPVELRCGMQKRLTGTADIPACPRFDRRSDGFRNRKQTLVRGGIKSRDPVACEKSREACPPWWGVCEHWLIF